MTWEVQHPSHQRARKRMGRTWREEVIQRKPATDRLSEGFLWITKKDKRKPLGKRCTKNIKSLQREVIQDGIIKMVTSTKLWSGPLQPLISWQKPWTMGRSCQNQFWENSEKQSKVYSSQTSTESRKRYHKMLTVTLSLLCGGNLKAAAVIKCQLSKSGGSLCPQCETIFLIPGEQSRPHSQIIVYAYSNLSGGYRRDWHKVLLSISLNSELRLEKLETLKAKLTSFRHLRL